MVGLLTEIGRAYMVVDNRLYLWNYNDSADFDEFDELDQLIVSVAVIPPKTNVFKSVVSHILVIATTTQVMLLPIVFPEEKRGVRGPMEIHPCRDYVIGTDNIAMKRMVGLGNGRLFMCGEDGNIYEFDYTLSSGWMTAKARKVNRTFNPFRLLLPSVFFSADQIIMMEVDSSRNYLWTFSQKNELRCYHVTDSNLTCLASNSKIFKEAAESFGERGASDWKELEEDQAHRIISLGCISRTESESVVLVATTSHAARIFFSLKDGYLTIKFVRLGPPTLESTGQATYPPKFIRNSGLYTVTTALTNVHLSLLANTIGNTRSSLIALTRQPFSESLAGAPTSVSVEPAVVARYTKHMIENVQEVALGPSHEATAFQIDKIEEIKELPAAFYMSPLSECLFAKNCENPLIGLSEFSYQHALPPSRYLILSDTSLRVIVRCRPVDELVSLLVEPQEAVVRLIKTFVQRYGNIETEAMLLLLACDHVFSSSAMSSLLRMKSSTESANKSSLGSFLSPDRPKSSLASSSGLKRTISNLYASPIMPMSSSAMIVSSSSDIALREIAAKWFFDALNGGVPENGFSGTQFSYKFRALYLVFTRLVRPFWEWSITLSSKNDSTPQQSRFSLIQLHAMYDPLEGFHRFVTDKNFFAKYEAGWPKNPSASAKAAIDTEKIYLQDFVLLVKRTLEALSMIKKVAAVSDPARPLMASVIEKLTAPSKNILKTLEFRQLVFKENYYDTILELSKELINAAINDDLGQVNTIIISQFNDECPFYFGKTDMVLQQAQMQLKLLDAQDTYGLVDKRKESFLSAYQLFVSICHLPQFDIKEAAAKCWAVHCYSPLLKLVITRLEKIGQQRLDDPKCFTVAIDTLNILILGEYPEDVFVKPSGSLIFSDEERNSTISDCLHLLCFSSVLELRWKVYAWLLLNKRTRDLFSLANADVVAYLSSDSNLALDLASYYIYNKKYVEASGHFLRLAKSDDAIKLENRLRYLAQAKICLESSQSGSLLEKRVMDKSIQDAELQQRILVAVQNLSEAAMSDNPSDDIDRLENNLLSLEILFRICKQYSLFEYCLLVIASTDDPSTSASVIPILWTNLIAVEINKGGDWHSRVEEIFDRLRPLVSNDVLFPLAHIIAKLEKFNLENQRDLSANYVPLLLKKVGILPESIATGYLQILRNLAQADEATRLHLIRASFVVCEFYQDRPNLPTAPRSLVDAMEGLLNNAMMCLVQLPSSIAKRELEETYAQLKNQVFKNW